MTKFTFRFQRIHISALIFACAIICSFVLFSPLTTYGAVSSIGIANYLPIASKNIQDGDIVSINATGYYLSNIPYDESVAGVITAHPAIMIRSTTQKGFPVIDTGTAYVKVSAMNGQINKGDMVTSSSIPGVGMKATADGYVLGEAIESSSFSNKNEIKEILVSLNIHALQAGYPDTSSLANIFSNGSIAFDQQPLRALQYLLAVVIVTLSFIFGFLIFVRFINTGIQALGRNPLAARAIQSSIILNVFLVILILLSGIALAYLMIRL